ncbi:MAG TPA: folylpolyglutamate synthase/dihydrofolate synthase family protein [Clostridia bacterium]
MDYKDAISYIQSLERFGSKPGLERIGALAERLGNPQDNLKFIHIAGTNGKGSTAAFISSVVTCAGYTTGLYTSPYLNRFNERIRINGEEISDSDLAEYTYRVKTVIDKMVEEGYEHPTEFETITALSLLYYYEKKCDVVILETGMGGRFDATNIIKCPLVSVITKISLDHTQVLGTTLESIAYEKAGIIKHDGIVVTYPQEESAGETIKAVCAERNAHLVTADAGNIKMVELKPGIMVFSHRDYGLIETGIIGIHQVYNAAVAVKVIEILKSSGFAIGTEEIRTGFLKASWPGRFELIGRNPDFYIDGAHNPDGVRSFIETYRRIYPEQKAIIIFGVSKDKDYHTMLRELSDIAEWFIAVAADTPRALPVKTLSNEMRKYCKNVEFSDTIKEAVTKSYLKATKDHVIAALGSLYYIGQVREIAGQVRPCCFK